MLCLARKATEAEPGRVLPDVMRLRKRERRSGNRGYPVPISRRPRPFSIQVPTPELVRLPFEFRLGWDRSQAVLHTAGRKELCPFAPRLFVCRERTGPRIGNKGCLQRPGIGDFSISSRAMVSSLRPSSDQLPENSASAASIHWPERVGTRMRASLRTLTASSFKTSQTSKAQVRIPESVSGLALDETIRRWSFKIRRGSTSDTSFAPRRASWSQTTSQCGHPPS